MQPKVCKTMCGYFVSNIEETSKHLLNLLWYPAICSLSGHGLWWQALNCCLVMTAAGVLCAAGGIGGGGDVIRFRNSNGFGCWN